MQTALQWTQVPRSNLILMHGTSGSGKSWLSGQLVAEIPAIRIRSDLERKRLAGLDPGQSAAAAPGEGIYSAQFSHRTYARLADCAELCLRAGFNVIIDAACLDPVDRTLLRKLAEQLHAGFVIIACQADLITLANRILQRGREHPDPSDASLSVLDRQLRDIQPFTAEEQPYLITVDTAQEVCVEKIAAAVSRCSRV